MNIEARKIEFVKEFLRLQNEDIISGLEQLLRVKKSDLLERDLKPMSKQQYDLEMDQAMEDSASGRMISVDDLKAKINKWN